LYNTIFVYLYFLLEVVLMSLIVQKFGGSSVRDYAHLLRMARIVKSRVDEGDDVVVVLSAQGDTTDGLLQKAKEISERPSLRELDMLLSAGEQMSAALGAMTLRSIGVEAVSLCAWQIPIETDGTHGNAEIELIDTARIRKELAEGYVVVAAGFQGVDERLQRIHLLLHRGDLLSDVRDLLTESGVVVLVRTAPCCRCTTCRERQ